MKVLSPLLKNVVYPSMARAGWFRQTSRGGLAIVTYHGVFPSGYESVDSALDGNLVTAEVLQKQLRLLKAQYNVVSPEDALAWREGRCALPERAVLLTCDDGLLNCLTDMLPVLRQESLKCLFFVTGGSAQDLRTSLWYEELLLIFLHAKQGSFEIDCEGIVIRGELNTPEQRRGVWWDSVKRLSAIDCAARVAFVAKLWGKFSLAAEICDGTAASQRRFGLLTA